MNSPVSSISSRFSAAVCRQAFRSSRNLAAARVPPFGTLRNLKDDSGLTFGTLRNPEDDRGLTFGNFRMYAEERGLTFGVGGTPVDRRRLKGKKFGQGFKNRLYSHPTGYPHSTYKDLRTFEESQTSKRQRLLNVSFKKRTRKRRNVLVSRSSTTKSLHTLQTSKRRRLLNVAFPSDRISSFNIQRFAVV